MMLLVENFEASLRFYLEGFGMEVAMDIGEGPTRLLQLRHAPAEAELWLVLAQTPAQLQRVGRQGHEMPLGVIYVADLQARLAALSAFDRQPLAAVMRDPDGAEHCRIADLYGNLWVIAQMVGAQAKRPGVRRSKAH